MIVYLVGREQNQKKTASSPHWWLTSHLGVVWTQVKFSSLFMSGRDQPKMYFPLNSKKKADSQVYSKNELDPRVWTGWRIRIASFKVLRHQNSFLNFALFDKFNPERWNVHYSSNFKKFQMWDYEWKSRTGLGARSH
jgi:hypothetical protein